MATTFTYLKNLLYSQFFLTPPYPATSFRDQTIIITGASSGLGLEAARHFARLRAATVVLAVRDTAKGTLAANDIRASLPGTKCRLEVWELDLARFASVRAFARKVTTKLGRLDVLVQNAGLAGDEFALTQDGHEMLLQVHVLAPALLTLLLLPLLRQSSAETRMRGRVTFCGSGIYPLADVKALQGKEGEEEDVIEVLDDPGKITLAQRYPLSKLLLVYLVQGLAQACNLDVRTEPVVNWSSPGFTRTNIMRKDLGVVGSFLKEVITTCLARTTEVGSRTLVDAVKCEDETLKTHGMLLRDCMVVSDPAPNVTSAESKVIAERFLDSLWRVLEKCEPGVTKALQPQKTSSKPSAKEKPKKSLSKLTMSWVDVSEEHDL